MRFQASLCEIHCSNPKLLIETHERQDSKGQTACCWSSSTLNPINHVWYTVDHNHMRQLYPMAHQAFLWKCWTIQQGLLASSKAMVPTGYARTDVLPRMFSFVYCCLYREGWKERYIPFPISTYTRIWVLAAHQAQRQLHEDKEAS